MSILPFISVIVPCYNQAQYLHEALDSILQQTYSSWECIIVNDGATDNTEQVALTYVKKDNRFNYLFKVNGGLSTARNAGLKMAKGQFIQFLDADDFLHPDKLLSAVSLIKEVPSCEIVICNYKYYNNSSVVGLSEYNLNREFSLKTILMEWDMGFTIPIHCGLIKRTILPFFNEKLQAKEDWLMWIDVFAKVKCYRFIDKQYAFYRLQPSSMSKKPLKMEENTFLAYSIIYEKICSEELRKLFFERLITYSKHLSQIKMAQIVFLNNTYSYRLGNTLIYPIKVLKKYTWAKKLISLFIDSNYIG